MLHLYPSSLLRSVGAGGEGGGAVFGPCMEHAVAILASPRAVLLLHGLQLWMGEGRDGTAHGSGSSWVKIRE